MRRLIFLWSMIFALRPAAAAFTGQDAGTAAAQFLRLGADARAAGMGEAVRAVAEDSTALYWNPAGLAGLGYRHAAFTHGAYYQSMFYDSLAYAQPSRFGSLAVAILYLNARSMPEVDNTGSLSGQSFSPQDLGVTVGWGAALARNLDVGISAKYVASKIEETAATGAVDFGARLRLRLAEMPYTLAAGIQNLGGRLTFVSQSAPLPLLAFVGNALRLSRNWVISAEVVAPRDGKPYPAAGTEILVPFGNGMAAALRAGYGGRVSSQLAGLSGLCGGGGLSFTRLAVDYAWAPFGLLGDTHRFSLSYRF